MSTWRARSHEVGAAAIAFLPWTDGDVDLGADRLAGVLAFPLLQPLFLEAQIQVEADRPIGQAAQAAAGLSR